MRPLYCIIADASPLLAPSRLHYAFQARPRIGTDHFETTSHREALYNQPPLPGESLFGTIAEPGLVTRWANDGQSIFNGEASEGQGTFSETHSVRSALSGRAAVP